MLEVMVKDDCFLRVLVYHRETLVLCALKQRQVFCNCF